MTNIVKVTDYDEFRSKIAEVKDACNFIPDVSTDDGYQKSKRVALDVGKAITALEAKRKELKKESLDYGRLVDSEAANIKEELQGFQLPHKEAYKELDNLKKEREANRKSALEGRITAMYDLPSLLTDSCSDEIKGALEELNREECLDFYEYTAQALKTRNSAKDRLSELFAKRLKEESDAAELAKLKLEKEERERKEREEKIATEAAEKAKREAEEKARSEQEAAAKREAEAKAKAEAAEQARIKAEAKAMQDAIDAEERQKAAVKAAKDKAMQDAENARIAEEEAAKAREADKKNRAAVNNAAVNALVAEGMAQTAAKQAVTIIARRKVPSISITY